jgi:hypothetical protein
MEIGPAQVVIVAVNAIQFGEMFPRQSADVELVDSDPQVPTLEKYRSWGEGDWWLRRNGDEVVLLDGRDDVVDAIAYGDSAYAQVVAHPSVGTGHSLERYPAWSDSDDCAADFRDQAYPNPGQVP